VKEKHFEMFGADQAVAKIIGIRRNAAKIKRISPRPLPKLVEAAGKTIPTWNIGRIF